MRMKYMGSKRVMLQNGLGELLSSEAKSATRIVDLFCGAASVSWFAAMHFEKPVAAFDLQEYAAALARAVVSRTECIELESIEEQWLLPALETSRRLKGWKSAEKLDNRNFNTATWRKRAQELCKPETAAATSVIWRCYGGHYYSPTQALRLDGLIKAIPSNPKLHDICLASTIIAASVCAAAPGHTAQPFKATRTAGQYLREAWKKDPIDYARSAAKKLAGLRARTRGSASVGDANIIAKTLREGDLVFIDPPYSSVHYSRFYHVLETIARRKCESVEGVGRYPPSASRPNSAYSRKDKSADAMKGLLRTLSGQGTRVLLTFPKGICSNGLSGDKLEETASEYFHVTRRSVKTRFSTLGGNRTNRAARRISEELILVLRP